MRLKKTWLAALSVVFFSACAPPVMKASGPEKVANPYVYPAPPDDPRFAFEKMIVNSADVTGISDQDRLKASLTGGAVSGEGFGKPYAIAVHQGRIFVSDTAARSILVFDVPEKKFFQIRDTPKGGIGKPLGIDVDAKGRLYVADGSARVIHVYDRDGKYIKQIGDEKQFDRLSSVTVNPEGTRLYAVDIGGVKSENHRVRVFNIATGEHEMDIGKRGTEKGSFNLPRDLAIGRDGRLYVVDGGNFRVQIFDRDGNYISSFGKVGKQLGDFARPKEIATDREGNVYVADAAFGNLQIFGPDGDLLMFIGERSETNEPGKYMLPSGIFVDEDNRIYMVDQWFRKVDVFRPAALAAGGGYFTKGSLTVSGSPSASAKAGSAVDPAAVGGGSQAK